MANIQSYREWYEYERDCNQKMLTMIKSVPAQNQKDPRFVRAVELAAHLAACREIWLHLMKTEGEPQSPWWPKGIELDSLAPRYARLEADWTAYLKQMDDEGLKRDFEFTDGGGRYRWSIEGQINQLYGHAFYHRGQIAMLVDALGGKTVDTDYVDWAYPRNPRYGAVETKK